MNKIKETCGAIIYIMIGIMCSSLFMQIMLPDLTVSDGSSRIYLGGAFFVGVIVWPIWIVLGAVTYIFWLVGGLL